MKDPGTAYDDPRLGKDPQPSHMRDYVDTLDDNGGVHINSGIPNRAFYLAALAMGGKAWLKAGRVWYLALTDALKERSDFRHAAAATTAVAGRELGKAGADAVRQAWRTVGVTTTKRPTPKPKKGLRRANPGGPKRRLRRPAPRTSG